MSVVVWNPDKHLELIEGWLDARRLPHAKGARDFYPPTGFVVDNAAVGFCYLTNAPGVCYIDNCITDPRSPGARRRQAVSTLLAALVDEATRQGATLIVYFAKHPFLVDIGKAHGFSVYGDGYACLALSGGKTCPPQHSSPSVSEQQQPEERPERSRV